MSGSSAPVSCTNANPQRRPERAQVERNFADATPLVEFGRVLVDR